MCNREMSETTSGAGMGDNMDDDMKELRLQKQFTDQIDQIVHATNREVINAVVPRLDRDTFAKMAKGVALQRVKYIAAAIQLSTQPFSAEQATQLKQMRENFEESRSAFDAVKRAIVRGYIDLAV